MDKKAVIILLRILIFMAGITFLLLFNTTPQNDCQACSIGEKELNGYEMYSYYEKECITTYKKLDTNITRWYQE